MHIADQSGLSAKSDYCWVEMNHINLTCSGYNWISNIGLLFVQEMHINNILYRLKKYENMIHNI